jgi:hypothetical protein
MTKIFMFVSLTLGLICLAVGWFMAGSWVVGLALLILLLASLFLLDRKFPFFPGLILFIGVFAAASGLWLRINQSLALAGLVCVLAAWDLEGFLQRLTFASAEDNPQLVERSHLTQVGLALLIGLAVSLFSRSVHFAFSFEWAFVLAALAFFGISGLINAIRPER